MNFQRQEKRSGGQPSTTNQNNNRISSAEQKLADFSGVSELRKRPERFAPTRYKENLSEVARLKGEHKGDTEEFKKASAAGEISEQLRRQGNRRRYVPRICGAECRSRHSAINFGEPLGAVGAMTLFRSRLKQTAEKQTELTAAIALGNGVQNVANALKLTEIWF